ncbi:hypothetical protein ACFU9X_45225 [Streptomyces atratus]|uniref:hypothetical protein n=1 Tax=Streptomyces atratus TaxID=1893 RepID=UPI00369FF36B
MTFPSLSIDLADPAPREPREGEADVLAAAGRRAADWVRALPAPETGRWIIGPLADAVEKAMTSLDPGDRDGVDQHGKGGIDDDTAETLAGLIYAVPETAHWLTPDQQVRLLAVVAAVPGIPRLLANDPGTAIGDGQVARMCAILDHATHP